MPFLDRFHSNFVDVHHMVGVGKLLAQMVAFFLNVAAEGCTLSHYKVGKFFSAQISTFILQTIFIFHTRYV